MAKSNNPTRKSLRQAAKEFNDVMALDPAIKAGGSVEKLKEDITEASEMLRDDDTFSDDVEKLLVELGIRKAAEGEESEEGKPPTSDAAESKKKETPAAKSNYNRIMSVCEALSKYKKQPSKEACAGKANDLYQKKAGGKDNMSESKWVTGQVFQVIAGMEKYGVVS